MSFYRAAGKRALDLVLAVPAAVIALPLAVVVAVAIRLRLGRPVLFRQLRPGLGAEPFTLYKFRTMADGPAGGGGAAPDGPRLGALGRLLRRWSLDELPQLVNVIRGDMSLVGPRPLLMEYLERYSPEQMRRHQVRPGLTGWAQIHGRNDQSWEQRFRLDLWYVDNLGLRLDARILRTTAWKLIRGEGVSAPGHATMPEFTGSGRE